MYNFKLIQLSYIQLLLQYIKKSSCQNTFDIQVDLEDSTWNYSDINNTSIDFLTHYHALSINFLKQHSLLCGTHTST